MARSKFIRILLMLWLWAGQKWLEKVRRFDIAEHSSIESTGEFMCVRLFFLLQCCKGAITQCRTLTTSKLPKKGLSEGLSTISNENLCGLHCENVVFTWVANLYPSDVPRLQHPSVSTLFILGSQVLLWWIIQVHLDSNFDFLVVCIRFWQFVAVFNFPMFHELFRHHGLLLILKCPCCSRSTPFQRCSCAINVDPYLFYGGTPTFNNLNDSFECCVS